MLRYVPLGQLMLLLLLLLLLLLVQRGRLEPGTGPLHMSRGTVLLLVGRKHPHLALLMPELHLTAAARVPALVLLNVSGLHRLVLPGGRLDVHRVPVGLQQAPQTAPVPHHALRMGRRRHLLYRNGNHIKIISVGSFKGGMYQACVVWEKHA